LTEKESKGTQNALKMHHFLCRGRPCMHQGHCPYT